MIRIGGRGVATDVRYTIAEGIGSTSNFETHGQSEDISCFVRYYDNNVVYYSMHNMIACLRDERLFCLVINLPVRYASLRICQAGKTVNFIR